MAEGQQGVNKNRQKIKDAIFLPIRLLFDHERVSRLGLTSVYDERIKVCKQFNCGKVLDIGCGEGNRFILEHGDGVGVDRLLLEGVDVCCDALYLPFRDDVFDTVSFIGSFNYLPEKVTALREASRVLRGGGRVLITMINPVFCYLRHKVAWWDKEQNQTKKGEGGLWKSEIQALLCSSGLRYEGSISYLFGLSHLFIGSKPTPVDGIQTRA